LGAQGNESDALPHALSPSGRYVLSHDPGQVLLAENTGHGKKHVQAPSSKSPQVRPVTFLEFNNKGPAKYVEAVKSNQMGVHPAGNLPFVNAVELVFTVDLKLAKKMRLKEYRCRQKVHSQEVWERELKDGKETPWTKTMSDTEGPDDPDTGVQTIVLPIIAYYDQPGFSNIDKKSDLKGPQEKLTSKKAVRVFMRQNFVGWVEGARGSGESKKWEQVSDEVKWHSNQSLLRDIFFTHQWTPILNDKTDKDETDIALGHSEGQPK